MNDLARSVTIDVRVIPRAGRAGIVGTRQGAWLVRLNAPPVDGAANRELIELLAETLDLPRRAITIIAGERTRTKTVRIDGMTIHDVNAKFKIQNAK